MPMYITNGTIPERLIEVMGQHAGHGSQKESALPMIGMGGQWRRCIFLRGGGGGGGARIRSVTTNISYVIVLRT